MWPYGGQAYVLSRGLLNAIGRDYWAHCMSALQCANADHRVMTCVLNAGYSLTSVGRFPTLSHHAQAPASADDKCWSSYTVKQGWSNVFPLYRLTRTLFPSKAMHPLLSNLILYNIDEEGPSTKLKCVSKADHEAEVFTNAWAAAQPDESLVGNLGTPESQKRNNEARLKAHLEKVAREEARKAAREGKGGEPGRLGPRARGQCPPDGRGSTFGGPGGPCGTTPGDASEPTDKRSRRKANDALKQNEAKEHVEETHPQVSEAVSGESNPKESKVGIIKKAVDSSLRSSSSTSSGALESESIREVDALLAKHRGQAGLPHHHVSHQKHDGGATSENTFDNYGAAGHLKLGSHHKDHRAPKFGLPSR